jgi:hypothetical protein
MVTLMQKMKFNVKNMPPFKSKGTSIFGNVKDSNSWQLAKIKREVQDTRL